MRLAHEAANSAVQRVREIEPRGRRPVVRKDLTERLQAFCKVAALRELAELARVLEEREEAARDPGPELCELLLLLADVRAEIEHEPVFEEVSPMSRKLVEAHVVGHRLPGSLEERREHMRHCENGGTEVKAKAGLLRAVELPAGPEVFLEHRHGVAFGRERDRGGTRAHLVDVGIVRPE